METTTEEKIVAFTMNTIEDGKHRKLCFATRQDAIVDLELERQVKHEDLLSYSDYTPYDGWTLKGWPTLTMSRGTVVMEDGKIVGPEGHGVYLSRPLVGSQGA